MYVYNLTVTVKNQVYYTYYYLKNTNEFSLKIADLIKSNYPTI